MQTGQVVPAHQADRNVGVVGHVVRSMHVSGRSLAAVVVLTGAVTAGAGAQTNSPGCSSDVLTVDGNPIAATFCAAPGNPDVTVTETFSAGGKSFSKPLTLRVVPGAAATNAVDNVDLGPLGSTKRLHLDIAYRNGRALLEHALLLPGAIVLK
jgi:hypothetical protein